MCLSCAQGLHAQFLLDLTHTWTNHKLSFSLSLVLTNLSITQEEILGVNLRGDKGTKINQHLITKSPSLHLQFY